MSEIMIALRVNTFFAPILQLKLSAHFKIPEVLLMRTGYFLTQYTQKFHNIYIQKKSLILTLIEEVARNDCCRAD
jgi:hypothetical protein